MANWLRDFAAGMQIGESFMDNVRESKLRGGLSALDKQQLEEVYAEQPADSKTEQSKLLAAQNEGLTAELPPTRTVSGYKYGDQTFQYKPPTEYIDALKAKQRAALFEQYGDIDKAQVYRESATKQLADSYKTIAETAFAKGTPEAIVNAYSLINDGFDAKLEKNKDGTLRVLLHPEGQPDQTEEIFSGDSASVVDWAMKNTNPELYLKFADAATMRDYRKSLLEDRQLAREDRATAAQDRVQVQQQQQLLQQAKYWEYVANNASTEEAYTQAMQKRDEVARQLSGLGGGLSRPPTVGSPQAGAIPPEAMYDYLVSKHGVDPTKAVGIVTNIGAESAFIPTRVHDEKNGVYTGYGLLGHRDPDGKQGRRAKLFQHAGNPNPSWTQQLDYAMTEPEMQEYLSKDYGGDYKQATKDFVRIFEKPKYEAEAMANRAEESSKYAGLTGRAESPALIAFRNGAPQQGLTSQPSVGGIDYGAQFRARQEAARQPKAAKEMSAKERLEAMDMALGMLSRDPGFAGLSYQDQLKKAAAFVDGTGDYDANGSMGQIANGGAAGTAKGNGGGLTSDFASAAQGAAQKAKQDKEDKEKSTAQAKAGAELQKLHRRAIYGQSDRVNEIGSYEPMTNADALAVYTQIRDLWASLAEKDRKLASEALNALYAQFPDAQYPQ